MDSEKESLESMLSGQLDDNDDEYKQSNFSDSIHEN